MRGEGGEARAGEGGRGSQSVETSSIVNAFGCESRRKSEGYSLRLFTNFAYFFPPFSLSLLHCVYLIFFVVLFLPPLPFFSVFSSPLLAICHTHAYRVQAFLTSHCILLLEAALSAFGLILFYMSAACCVFVCWYTGCTLSAFFSLHASLWLSFFLLFPLADSLSSGWAPVHDVCFMSLLGLSLFSP